MGGRLATPPALTRQRIRLQGQVQGVGFRPFVFRLADEFGLAGQVNNTAGGVTIEVEGVASSLVAFRRALRERLPPLARVDGEESTQISPTGRTGFVIEESAPSHAFTALAPPDIATCGDCLGEIFDSVNRRHLYPFTNCTNCGPRFSILEGLPYDRARTTMRRFQMCATCEAEYRNPLDRRFHAQPNACPDCGPQLRLLADDGRELAVRQAALELAATALRDGLIVAMKGLGGFQLLADARSTAAVARLRQRKNRPVKPFAIMAPSLAAARGYCAISAGEKALLQSPAAPIVLVERRQAQASTPVPLSALVAPGNAWLGVMLPYTPLHHLLLRQLNFPILATSGNLADEPMAIDEAEAVDRLSAIADVFLSHDRPIARAVDDSVQRLITGRPMMLRLARGFAPLAIRLPQHGPGQTPTPAILGLGGHLKAAAALTVGKDALLGPHVGDLDTELARSAFERSIDGLVAVHGQKPAVIARDRHPDYHSSRYSSRLSGQSVLVQHHLAHISACIAENGVEGPVLGVAWDGAGLGDDGTIWGGEFIRVEGTLARRLAHIRPFRLPGGEAAIREPRRMAFSLLFEIFGDALIGRSDLLPVAAFAQKDRRLLAAMLRRKLNAPISTSAGRLFDAVAALLGLVQISSCEGEAAISLESLQNGSTRERRYRFAVRPVEPAHLPLHLDWQPVIEGVVRDLADGIAPSVIAGAFHQAMIDGIADVADAIGERQIALSGGCFQNKTLAEGVIEELRARGFTPFWHRLVPPNDGGLAFGQAAWSVRLLQEGRLSCA
jgi:hydrogenase maturation protein HypF